ncbi:nucleoside phosphorylase domain-containing protein [Xylaria sp. FL1042]|nr:nucleoside phosphorylase domain-containing protein [Xylaria sp. FL1042]
MDTPPADTLTVGLVYVKPLEMVAIGVMMDVRYASIPVAHGDFNDYILGRIGDHNVVMVGPARGDQGTVATAQFAATIHLTFPNIKIGLLVGIGGGIPRDPKPDVRLGDVVVGAPETGPAVVQYDLGKRTATRFEVTRSVAQLPSLIRKVVNKVEASERWQVQKQGILESHLERLSKTPWLRSHGLKPLAPDRLFQSTFLHEPGTDCATHDVQFERIRAPREPDHIAIHYSTILSGNTPMNSSEDRDRLAQAYSGALCFGMEAAGLMDVFPCLVIRGISDYSDSHKNDSWQNYAAATAASYARELLLNLPKQTIPRAPQALPLVKANENDSLVDQMNARYNTIFSGTGNNSGLQLGYNTGTMTNNFGGGIREGKRERS